MGTGLNVRPFVAAVALHEVSVATDTAMVAPKVAVECACPWRSCLSPTIVSWWDTTSFIDGTMGASALIVEGNVGKGTTGRSSTGPTG